jgi:hypothetical protein
MSLAQTVFLRQLERQQANKAAEEQQRRNFGDDIVQTSKLVMDMQDQDFQQRQQMAESQAKLATMLGEKPPELAEQPSQGRLQESQAFGTDQGRLQQMLSAQAEAQANLKLQQEAALAEMREEGLMLRHDEDQGAKKLFHAREWGGGDQGDPMGVRERMGRSRDAALAQTGRARSVDAEVKENQNLARIITELAEEKRKQAEAYINKYKHITPEIQTLLNQAGDLNRLSLNLGLVSKDPAQTRKLLEDARAKGLDLFGGTVPSGPSTSISIDEVLGEE